MQDKRAVLKQVFGYDAFREGQEALIDALLSGRDALGVMPTGAGKSICYQVPALLLPGITLVVSPLISLMKDQVMALKQAGVAGAYLNSSLTPGQCQTVTARAAAGWYKIIYVAPERLDAPSFLDFARRARISALIVDEAHCISQWGQDFRPSYLKIADFLAALPARPVVGAFTATATERVRRDIVASLGLQDPLAVSTGFDRPNLYFAVWKRQNKYGALTDFLADKRGKSGIVYCATRKTVEEVCADLCRDGYAATRYHAGLSDAERKQNQDDFQYDKRTVMVATNAFGMGIDKSNVSYVVHYNMPKNLESYYQEAGRAGRDGTPADCLLLYGKRDVATARWLIQHGGGNPDLTAEERGALEARELERLKQMTFYATTGHCLRNAILRYFGEYRKADCGRCGNCCQDARAQEEAAAERPNPHKLRPNAQAAGDPAEYDALYLSLKALRSSIAAEERAPAYVVFTDATLTALALYRPQSLNAFGDIIGVGAVKREKYGERFLARIREVTGDAAPQPERPAPSKARPAPAACKPSKRGAAGAYRPWTAAEEAQLRNEHRVGLSIGQLAEVHGRTKGAIRARLKKMGLGE